MVLTSSYRSSCLLFCVPLMRLEHVTCRLSAHHSLCCLIILLCSTVVSLKRSRSSVLHPCLPFHPPPTHTVLTSDSKEPEGLFHPLFLLPSVSAPPVSLGGFHLIKQGQLLAISVIRDPVDPF